MIDQLVRFLFPVLLLAYLEHTTNVAPIQGHFRRVSPTCTSRHCSFVDIIIYRRRSSIYYWPNSVSSGAKVLAVQRPTTKVGQVYSVWVFGVTMQAQPATYLLVVIFGTACLKYMSMIRRAKDLYYLVQLVVFVAHVACIGTPHRQ
jgi:hypothetical protein